MKRIVGFLTASLMITALIAGISGCKNSNAESENKNAEKAEPVMYVKTEKIQLTRFTKTVQLTGNIQSMNDIIVPAEEGGRITDWYISKGSYVKKGQLIGQIDSVRQRAGYDAASAAYRITDINYEKQKKAYEEQAISELQLKTLEYQRDAARAQMELAFRQLEKTKMISPANGFVNDRFVDAGEMIGPGMPVIQVVDVHSLKITAGVPERYSADLIMGAPVEFTVDAYPDEVFTGKIGFIAASVTSDNRSIPVEIYFSNPSGKLKPMMIAKIQLRLRADEKSVVIPQDIVQLVDMNRLIVFIVKNGRAEERLVKADGTDGKSIRIINGLNAGEELITVGYQNLINNQKVIIQE
jgi:membrane fusion protein (multidrug efflux system)